MQSPITQTRYEIVVEGQLEPRWADWFAPMDLSHPTPTTTRLVGALADQSALYGILKKLHHLGLPLISVNRLALDEGGKYDQHQDQLQHHSGESDVPLRG